MDDIQGQRFDRLLTRYERYIRKICWSHSAANATRCGELVEECYVDIVKALPTLDAAEGSRRERAWVRWRCRHVLSRHRRHRFLWLSYAADIAVDNSDAERRELIEELAADLSGREREYLDLYIEGYTPSEIAQLMHIKDESVYRLRQRVITRMKETLKKIDP